MIHVELTPSMTIDERLSAWRDVMRLAGDIDVTDPETFVGTFTSTAIGEMRTMLVASGSWRLHRDRTTRPHIERDHVILNLIETGAVQGSIAGRIVHASPGDVILSRTTNELDLTFTAGRWLGVLLPRPVVERHLRWSRRLDGSIYRATSTQAILLAGLIRSLCAMPVPLVQHDIMTTVIASLHLIATCLGNRAPTIGDDKTGDHATAQSIRRFIASKLPDPELNIAMICREFGMSRSTLYRVLVEHGDVATVIRTLRLQAAAADLVADVGGNLPITTVARRWGFTDERTFRRSFVREFGYPPSAAREFHPPSQLPGTVSIYLQRWFLGG